MISYLKGTGLHKTASSVMVLCGAVGYEVQVPSSRLLRYTQQQPCEFYIYYQQREDAVQLFGFESWAEREFFMTLLNVSGIGPKGALAIIGQSTLSGFYQAIAGENVEFLTKVPGIGKKTAQRLVLELKDKVAKGFVDGISLEDVAGASAQTPAAQSSSQAIAALVSLGYSQSEAALAVSKIDATLPVEEIIKLALRGMAAGRR